MFILEHLSNFFSFSTESIDVETKSLATTQFILTSLCICPANEFTTPSKKRANIAFISFVVATQFGGLAASLSFLIKFTLIDFERSLFAFLAFIGHSTLIYTLLTALSSRHKIGDIFKQLTTIYGNSKHAF